MSTKQEVSKQACAKYAKLRGDLPQQAFRYKLNEFILKGIPVADAEAQALAFVRQRTPGFEPTLAAQPIINPVQSEKVREDEEGLRRHGRNPRGVGRSKLSPPTT